VPVSANEEAEGRPRTAALNSPGAETLGDGRFTAGLAAQHRRYNTIPARDAHALHHQGRDVHGKNHEERYALHLGYGLTESADVYLVVPWVHIASIEIHEHDSLGQDEAAQGPGDVRLLGKLRRETPLGHVALLGGISAPTGETSDRAESGDKFPPELQPGSGSWDLEAGIAVSRNVGARFAWTTSAQYLWHNEGAQDFKAGDLIRWSFGASRAIGPATQPSAVSLVLELNAEWAMRDQSRAERHVLDSGGTTVLISPGLMARLNERLSAYVSVPVPVYQNLGGQHEELKYAVLSGISWAF
jgi:hypothetical protein